MARITLTNIEKNNIRANGKIEIARIGYMNHPRNSILHGRGAKCAFDKIDHRWVFGDPDDYVLKMMNVGRRRDDYKDNKPNTWNGSYWWDCMGTESEFGTIGSTFVSGRKEPLTFKVDDIHISELKPTEDDKYLKMVFLITLVAE